MGNQGGELGPDGGPVDEPVTAPLTPEPEDVPVPPLPAS